MAEGRIVVAGETVIDLVEEPGGRYRPVPGGSPANVAVGLGRLGVPTHMLARLGRGRFGRLIRDHLVSNDVLLDLAVDAEEPPTLAVVSLDDDGRAGYDFYADGTADWEWTADELPDPLPAGTVALCAGSIAAARQPGAPTLLQLIRREHGNNKVTIVLDPNIRASLLGDPEDARDHWDTLVELADVIKVSDEDLDWLVPDIEIDQIAKGWAECGPSLIVVTRGDAGAFAVTSEGVEVEVPAPDVDVVDTVGAGDAFTAGLVDALRQNDLLGASRRQALAETDVATLEAMLAHAARIAALTCTRQGADPPRSANLG